MKTFITALGLLLVFALAITMPTAAGSPAPTSPVDALLGQQLVERLWTDFAKADLPALDQFVAAGFQSLHEDGARDWSEERVLAGDLKLTPYVLSDYKVTRQGDTMLVTYQCRVGETIVVARLSKEMSPRMDVFQLTNGEWKLLSHVNVRKLGPLPQNNTRPMIIAALKK